MTIALAASHASLQADAAQRQQQGDRDMAAATAASLASNMAAHQPDGGRDVLHKLRGTIDDFLRDKGSCLEVIGKAVPNEHAAVGEPLYERFLRAWVETDMNVRLVFHGTKEKNVGTICQHGLDPTFRGRGHGQVHGDGEYFANDAQVSVSYCDGGRVMLVFAVLTDPSGMKDVAAHDIVVVHEVTHQLPLFKVRYRYLEPPRRLKGAARPPRMMLAPRSGGGGGMTVATACDLGCGSTVGCCSRCCWSSRDPAKCHCAGAQVKKKRRRLSPTTRSGTSLSLAPEKRRRKSPREEES